MRTFRRFNWQMVAFCYVLTMITTFLAVESTYGLHMSQTSSKAQTTVSTPRDRAIQLKLPLLQPEFHWGFISKQDFLAGKLVLSITRAGETNTITIFENGKISEGWEPFPTKNPKQGEIYFGFLSSKKYPTAPGDRLKIELQVKKDLDGIGPTETGVLPAGTYRSEGTYSGLIDEFTISDTVLKGVPEEKVAALYKMFVFKAFLENWETQWPLKITSEEGWLSPEQRQQNETFRKAMENQTKAGEEPELIPLFSVKSLDGKEVQENYLKGKAVLVYFWNTQDSSCQQQFQIFDKMIQKYQGKDIVFMAITEEPKETVNIFMQTHNYKMPVFLSKDKTAFKLSPTRSTPLVLLIGRKTKGIFIIHDNPVVMNEKDVSEAIQEYVEVSPIHDAATLGDVEKVKTLLEGNPGLVNVKNSRGRTPLYCTKTRDMAEVFITHKADVNAKDSNGNTPLHQAAMNGYKDVTEVLLSHNADVNARNNIGQTPLHGAVSIGRENLKDMVELLISHNADVNAKDNYGSAPLHRAINKDAIEVLITHKADINAKDNNGWTPLHEAAMGGNKDTAEALLSHKADVNAKDKDGSTPLDYAAANGHKEVVEVLLANKADVNAKDEKGLTPLHWAAYGGSKEMIELLLDNKADINAQNINGKTPLDLALSRNHNDAAELLRQHGGVE